MCMPMALVHNKPANVCMHGYKHVCMYVCMYERMYVCMYVCTQVQGYVFMSS